MKLRNILCFILLSSISTVSSAINFNCDVIKSDGLLAQALKAKIQIDLNSNILIFFKEGQIEKVRILAVDEVLNNSETLKVTRIGPDFEERSFIMNKSSLECAVVLKDEGKIYASANLNCVKIN